MVYVLLTSCLPVITEPAAVLTLRMPSGVWKAFCCLGVPVCRQGSRGWCAVSNRGGAQDSRGEFKCWTSHQKDVPALLRWPPAG